MQLKRRAALAEGENHRLMGERNKLKEQLVAGPASEGAFLFPFLQRGAQLGCGPLP